MLFPGHVTSSVPGDGMQDLIGRIATAAGVEPAVAEQALGAVLAFLAKEVSPETLAKLSAALPNAEAIIAGASQEQGLFGTIGAMMGGGIGALGSQLMGMGLGLDQIQSLGHELFSFTAETAGPEVVGEILEAVPALKSFM
ncbi:MAG: DUF2267 domain-containing protein [Labrys sp. (in: a-proteobacteria)]